MTRDPYDSLRHALTLIPLIQAQQGITIEELAAKTGLSVRTITDEVAKLVMMCGVPPYAPNNYVAFWVDRGRVYVRFAEQFERPVRLVLQEALALLLALKPLEAGDHPFTEAVRGLRAKILAALDPEAQKSIRRTEKAFQRPARATPGRIGELREAMARCRELRVVYWSAHRAALSTRVIRPYAMAEHDGDWYVIAHDSVRDEVVSFRVDRIREAELLETEYEVPADFDVKRWNRDRDFVPAPTRVTARVRFSGDAVKWARDEISRRELTEQPDGSVIANVEVRSDEFVLSWLLQFGPGCEILDPAELREKMAGVCRRLLAWYDQPLPPS